MYRYLVINCDTGLFYSQKSLESYLHENPVIDTLLFVYWKWKVPDKILNKYRCVGFHTGPLLEGKGRGGSPIQNLKKLGVRITTLCAFEMTDKFDEGKVLLAVPLSLEGSMDDIWDRINCHLPEMIDYLICDQPEIPDKFTREMALA